MMATITERVPVLMTTAEKSRVVANAKKAGVAIGEYIRRAVDSYRPMDDDKALEAMIEQMNKATSNAEKSIDETLIFIASSNQKINEMENLSSVHP